MAKAIYNRLSDIPAIISYPKSFLSNKIEIYKKNSRFAA